MKKRQVRILLFALLITTLLSACTTGSSTTDTSSNTTTSPSDSTSKTGTQSPDRDYKEADFTILISGNSAVTINDFKSDESSSNRIDVAVYNRNKVVEEKYSVKIKTIEDFGGGNTAVAQITNTVSAGDYAFDAAMLSSYDAPKLAYQPLLYNLNSIPYLDLTKDYWDQNANANFTIQNILYYTTGDISYWDDALQHCVAFNKAMLKDYNADVDLYKMVEEGKWTLEAMNEIAKKVTGDLNNYCKYDENYLYGLMLWDDTVYGMINALGTKIIDIDHETGKLTLGIDNNETLLTMLTEFTNIGKSQYTFNFQRVAGGDLTKTINVFSDNRALFFMTLLKELDLVRNMETDYGIFALSEIYRGAGKLSHLCFFLAYDLCLCSPGGGRP